jgi:hypothetical protein
MASTYRQPSPLVAALAQAVLDAHGQPTGVRPDTEGKSGAHSTLPLLAVLARVSLAVSVRAEAAGEAPRSDLSSDATKAPRADAYAEPPRPGETSASEGADRPRQRYGPIPVESRRASLARQSIGGSRLGQPAMGRLALD